MSIEAPFFDISLFRRLSSGYAPIIGAYEKSALRTKNPDFPGLTSVYTSLNRSTF